MATVRLTLGQAIVRFMMQQYVERDGEENPFFAGCWGIFGHGNIGGVAQALQQYGPGFRYYQTRNEQAMVMSAMAYAKMKNRKQTFACLSSIGPGATNMVTGAATATINRIPVLLLAGDIFAERVQAPVLQQLESEHSLDISVNDCFKPVSRYWDRISRPEQAIQSLLEAMRVLTSPADTGAVTLALPQDIQTYAFDYPAKLFEKRVWTIPRNRPDAAQLRQAAEWIRASQRPLIIAGGGVHYSEAFEALRRFVEQTGIPVSETQAGKGSLVYDHPLNLGGVGVTGTKGANLIEQDADLVIGIGTRYSDFPTASKTAFQNPDVRFININVFEMDAHKHAAIPLVGDAKVTLEELGDLLAGYRTDESYQQVVKRYNAEWDAEVTRVYNLEHGPLMSQGELIGVVNELSDPRDVVMSAAGSFPGDLHKLWRTRDIKGYHLEYGYSTMGYEIAGGLGIKLADPSRDVFVMVGDASFLMMNTEIITSIQEGQKLIIMVSNNNGYSSVGRVSEQVGSEGFGCHYRYRGESGWYDGDVLPVDFAKIAEGMGAIGIHANSKDALADAIQRAKQADRTVVIVTETDWHERVPGYGFWWDMATAHTSEMPEVNNARERYEAEKKNQRYLI
jgi:3D-(3,5/4)-trihydroxycyclohexane-1,2-dione acylhydrolase (decyclizing)